MLGDHGNETERLKTGIRSRFAIRTEMKETSNVQFPGITESSLSCIAGQTVLTGPSPEDEDPRPAPTSHPRFCGLNSTIILC